MGGITDEFRDHFSKKERLMRKSGSPGKEGFFRSGKSINQVRETHEQPISETREYRTHGKQKMLSRQRGTLLTKPGGGKGGWIRKLVNSITGNPLE